PAVYGQTGFLAAVRGAMLSPARFARSPFRTSVAVDGVVVEIDAAVSRDLFEYMQQSRTIRH
ncbi:hypothetical protein K3X14_14745, partial [Listeria monocytogenes]|nr:hypothetical protein [Listeria monocytogenes]